MRGGLVTRKQEFDKLANHEVCCYIKPGVEVLILFFEGIFWSNLLFYAGLVCSCPDLICMLRVFLSI